MFRRAFQPVQQALLFGRGCRTFATAKDATSSASGSEQLKVTFATPNQVLFKHLVCEQVNLNTATGAVGILSKHIPALIQIQPGVVEIIESPGKEKSFFVSGGYGIMAVDNTLTLTAIEAFTLDQFDEAATKKTISNAENIIKISTNENEKACAEYQMEIAQKILSSLKK